MKIIEKLCWFYKVLIDLIYYRLCFEYANAACGAFEIVYNKDPPQELIDLVTEYADHMITTVKETE